MSREIEFLISPDGTEVIVAPKGIKGSSCTQATRPYEVALGLPDEAGRQRTQEFHQQPAALREKARVGHG